MKQLTLGVVLLAVFGTAGFLYRNTMEQPVKGPEGLYECQADAKVCPDGTSLGRTGPNCEFAVCPFPNIALPLGIVFATPEGYVHEEFTYPGVHFPIVRLAKPSLSESAYHRITIDQYVIPEGQTADDVILENTRYQPADMEAEDFSRFKTVTIGGKEYRVTVIERFEALVQSSYFLARENDVLRFDIVEHDVVNWTDPALNVRELPEHKALESLLATLQI